MNEKIKQLLLDAGGQYSSGNQNDWPSWVLGDAVVTKFAELIVKETLQVARAGIAYGDGMEDAVYKYFGVEE